MTDIQDIPDTAVGIQYEEQENNENLIVEEDSLTPVADELPKQQETAVNDIMDKPLFTAVEEPQPVTFTNPVAQKEEVQPAVTTTIGNSKISIPANVAVLKNLISTLPVGVTKQTGAQIIRQTLEAMGLPMNSVLKEAQEVQEELNSSTRECMVKIQEYKTNILQLEQSVQEYQKNVTQINDLVSLFLLTDRK